MSGQPARTWPYVVAGVIFAGIIGWISYTDALIVTTLAGNRGGIAYAYPVIPDGLLFFSLLAAWEAARAGVPRSRWAVTGLVLGAGMTLAANTGAGLQRSVLDAVIDFLIPVCFFVAVEIVLWHVRRGRGVSSREHPAHPPAASVSASVPSLREIQARQRCGQATAKKVRAELRLFASSPAGVPPPTVAPAGAAERGRDGSSSEVLLAVPATLNGQATRG